MTTAGEFCNRTVFIIRKRDALLEAARRMREHHVGDLVVVEDRGDVRVPVAMLTDRDLVVSVLAITPEQMPKMTVGDVLSQKLVKVRESEPLEDVFKLMRAASVRRIPVVDTNEALVGVISFDDALAFVAEQLTDLARLLTRANEQEPTRRP